MGAHPSRAGTAGYLRWGCRCDECTAAFELDRKDLDRYLNDQADIEQIASERGVTRQAVSYRLGMVADGGSAAEVKRNQPCKVPGCNDRRRSRGWCLKHYQRWRAHGDPLIETSLSRPPVTPVNEPPDNGNDDRTWQWSWSLLADFCKERPGQWYRIDVPGSPGLPHHLSGKYGLETAWRDGDVYVRATSEVSV